MYGTVSGRVEKAKGWGGGGRGERKVRFLSFFLLLLLDLPVCFLEKPLCSFPQSSLFLSSCNNAQRSFGWKTIWSCRGCLELRGGVLRGHDREKAVCKVRVWPANHYSDSDSKGSSENRARECKSIECSYKGRRKAL